jgi:hypothetical protein
MWVWSDVLGLFSVQYGLILNYCGFERYYILVECGHKHAMFSGRRFYVLGLLQLATLSPYQTEHINRFGTYILNFQRTPPPLDLEFWMLAQ